jgi:hypothetical protein
MTGLTFRASVCGRYVVSIVGDHVRVLTVDEATDVAVLYRNKHNEVLAAGRPELAEHERVAAVAIERAVLDAHEMRRAIISESRR